MESHCICLNNVKHSFNVGIPPDCSLRLRERRRSSMVVSLPGLDVSPGDLFVSNGVADILNGTNCSGKTLIYIVKIT